MILLASPQKAVVVRTIWVESASADRLLIDKVQMVS
jgi:hypothetical protein